jgi:hypothetical protein
MIFLSLKNDVNVSSKSNKHSLRSMAKIAGSGAGSVVGSGAGFGAGSGSEYIRYRIPAKSRII